MGGVGAWLLWACGAAWIAYMFAVARGMTPIGRVRDERDAFQARWLFGGLTAVGGLALAFGGSSLIEWAIAAGLAASGAAVISTARRLAPTDPTNKVPASEIQRVARQFVFDSRPPARGPLEIHPKRGWSIFIAACLIGFSALLVMVGIDAFTSTQADLVTKVSFFVGMSVFFLIVLIAPSAWWTQRVLRGIPFLRIDQWGLVMGRDPRRDAAITWDDVRAVEVRLVSSDRLLLVHPTRPDWNDRQPWIWRIYGRLSRMMYGSHFAISTMALSVPIEELLARVAAHRPSSIGPESPADPAAMP